MTYSSIIDNSEGNLLIDGLGKISQNCTHFDIASAFFSLDALGMLAEKLQNAEKIRLLFGDDASKSDRRKLLAALRERSDVDLAAQRTQDITLTDLQKAKALILSKKFEARCYTKKKFHAKAYIAYHADEFKAVMGSGNFTRQGMTQNIELNARMSHDQSPQLQQWFEERWKEAEQDIVTDDLLKEITRQLDLYDPYAVYLKALLAWGSWNQADENDSSIRIYNQLDQHQKYGYLRAMRIMEREQGVMILDGVGLGKSFIAMAIIQRCLTKGLRVLLVAPKAILENSWRGYIREYLRKENGKFGKLEAENMTWFGIDPKSDYVSEAKRQEFEEAFQDYCEDADVIVIDESHNFRTTNAFRYKQLETVLKHKRPDRPKRQVVLLTATPISTGVADLTNQMKLISGEHGALGGIPFSRLTTEASKIDKNRIAPPEPQATFDFANQFGDETPIHTALSSVAIQRSRATCKAFAAEAGQDLRFPMRELPEAIEYELNGTYRTLVQEADRAFTALAQYLRDYKDSIKKATEEKAAPVSPPLPRVGLRLGAYLTEGYRRADAPRMDKGKGRRIVQTQAYLVGLIHVNALKQLESSIAAFDGIVRQLAAGLSARLIQQARLHDPDYLAHAETVVGEHQAWINLKFGQNLPDDDSLDEDEQDTDSDGEETDGLVDRALRNKKLNGSLQALTKDHYDVKQWREDIATDLKNLRQLHESVVAAQGVADPKFDEIKHQVRALLAEGKRVLIFTQSQRTSRYIAEKFKDQLEDPDLVGRIDGQVTDNERKQILYAFAPKYNPAPDKTIPEVRVLVATDVLSEGVNLQSADAILNYDLHWTPIRLIQRIGRVDRRLKTGDSMHTFRILNVIPPKEIERIINLVDIVEKRTTLISKTVGIDVSFFKATDQAGTLKEFNKLVDGEQTVTDVAFNDYIKSLQMTEEQRAVADVVPRGAFGTWGTAPVEGIFALYTLQLKPNAPDTDSEMVRELIGEPILVMIADGRGETDPGRILNVLRKTVPGQKSADHGDITILKRRLSDSLNEAKRRIKKVRELPIYVEFQLECWLELRK